MKKLRVSEHRAHAEIFQNSNIALSFHNAIIVVPTSTLVYKKAIGNIRNYHIIVTETNSSY
jgi:hypothetical protein